MTDLAKVAELLNSLKPYPGKSCGTCTACCATVPVKEIGLKAFTRCPHLRALPEMPGCSIYPRRPHSCRVWICGWLGADWPDDCRPDRCGVVVDPMQDLVWLDGKELPVVRLWVLPGREAAFHDDPVRALVLAIIDTGMGVIWDHGSEQRRPAPRPTPDAAQRPVDDGTADAADRAPGDERCRTLLAFLTTDRPLVVDHR
jgi:hypothetical protein